MPFLAKTKSAQIPYFSCLIPHKNRNKTILNKKSGTKPPTLASFNTAFGRGPVLRPVKSTDHLKYKPYIWKGGMYLHVGLIMKADHLKPMMIRSLTKFKEEEK